MSGGSYDYAYWKVEEFADSLRRIECDPRRASFQKLLKLVAQAMQDVEWVDSCDYGLGDEYAAIDKVFSFLGTDPQIIKKAHSFDVLKAQLNEFLKDD